MTDNLSLPEPNWATVVRPGDTLIIAFGRALEPADFQRVTKQISAALEPLGVRSIFVDDVQEMVTVRQV